MPFLTVSVLGEGSLTKIDCRKKGTLILASLLEDLSLNGTHQVATGEIHRPNNLCPFQRGFRKQVATGTLQISGLQKGSEILRLPCGLQ